MPVNLHTLMLNQGKEKLFVIVNMKNLSVRFLKEVFAYCPERSQTKVTIVRGWGRLVILMKDGQKKSKLVHQVSYDNDELISISFD